MNHEAVRGWAICAALLAVLAVCPSLANSAEQRLECTLYIAESVDHTSFYEVEPSDSSIQSLRRAGLCLFADGRLADKQFVMGMNIRNDGSAGDAMGISVYTFETGDTLTLSFIGRWDEGPFSGDYTVLHGTGTYAGATGAGTINGVDGPWQSTSVVDIRIDVTTTGQ